MTSALSPSLEPLGGLLARQRWIMSQPERLQIALTERQGKAHALIGRQGQNRLAVLRAQKIGDAAHRVRL